MSGIEKPELPGLGRKSSRLLQKLPKFTGFSTWFFGLFLAGATLVVYWPVREFDFVNYDDVQGILRSPLVRQGLTWPGVAWSFRNSHMGNWQPMTAMSYMVDGSVSHLKPAWPHSENVLLHISNAILLFSLLKRMTGARWRSGLVAALFALHPLHVESVAWISERKDVLSTFFFMLTLLAYAKYAESLESKVQEPTSAEGSGRRGAVWSQWPAVWYIGSILLFALGLMSKPMLVSVPFVLLLLDYWPLGRFQANQAKRNGGRGPQCARTAAGVTVHVSGLTHPVSRLVLEKLPFLALAACVSWITYVCEERSGALADRSAVPVGSRLANAAISYARYMGKMFWPRNLVMYYPRVLHWPAWQVVGAGLLLAAITLGAIRSARRRPYLMVGWLWFLGTLVPVIGLIQAGTQAMADRYTYVPLIGLFIIVGWAMGDWVGQEREMSSETGGRGNWRLGLCSVASAGVLACCLWISAKQVWYWQDSFSLFKHITAAYPELAWPNSMIGSALYDRGQYTEATRYLAVALRLKPDSVSARNTYGLCLWRSGNDQAALDQFNVALHDHGPDADTLYNMSMVYFTQGKLDQARSCLGQAVKLKPDSPEMHNNLGNLLATQGKFTEATREIETALRLAPDFAEAHYNLARCFQQKGARDKAIEQLAIAVKLKPDYEAARVALESLSKWMRQQENRR